MLPISNDLAFILMVGIISVMVLMGIFLYLSNMEN